MSGSKRCVQGCTCGKHTRSGAPGKARPGCDPFCPCGRHTRESMIDWSDRDARNAYARDRRARRRVESSLPYRP